MGAGHRYHVLRSPRRFARLFSSEDDFVAAVGALARATAMWMKVRTALYSAEFPAGIASTFREDWQKCMEVSEIFSMVSHV